ncbi:hypothetical protein C5C31_12915 [Rathayibacter rathayi]|uniref:Phytoene synthase n=1 Tax=Rathayibacter rathayi TaxID=33887 RepID=A0ABD6W622_RATRA|nr:hypothetical protein [Rathayibacter rathayi]AZZ49629.1 hypothetical protein C1O28_10900 [Rathayibacter rathayi]MWV75793.1 hypothetical protein [Rathayibacter rathayi NCPPB 2980 = VKM Ac-1601]PPF10898.1 hypothetical protein C5C04_12820 [Rathayibacter rathayi]PPF24176.1 hypothetical protein C5C34_06445 [Rathayibacter rathayi]PPF44361.1 hypothetical protein C5C08_13240 [Rathayibacter rathayi]
MGIAEPFDLEDHRRSARGTLHEHFSVFEFEEVPLDREAIVATAYLRAIEHATVARVLPIARAHPDERVREFARIWAAERHRIADALGDVLAASPQIRGIDVRPPEPTVESRPLLNRVAAALPGPVALALAVDARIAMHSYRRLARLSLHPEMERLAEAIIGVVERYADFFTVHAAGRLGRPLPRRVLAAGLLAVLRLPIGEADLPEALAREGRELVFGRDDGGLDGIDAGIVAAFALPCTAARRLVHPYQPASIRAAHRLGRLAADTRFAVATLLEQVRE